MGEVVEQLDLGSEPVNQGAVVIPTEEKLCGLHIDMTKSDQKWCSFTIRTSERDLVVEPGNFTQAAFDTFCGEVKAMF